MVAVEWQLEFSEVRVDVGRQWGNTAGLPARIPARGLSMRLEFTMDWWLSWGGGGVVPEEYLPLPRQKLQVCL